MPRAYHPNHLILHTRTVIEETSTALLAPEREGILNEQLEVLLDALSESVNDPRLSIKRQGKPSAASEKYEEQAVIPPVGVESQSGEDAFSAQRVLPTSDITTLPAQVLPGGDGAYVFDGFVLVDVTSATDPPCEEYVEKAILRITQQFRDREGRIVTGEDGITTTLLTVAPNIKLGGANGDELTGGGPGALPIAIDKAEAESSAEFAFMNQLEAQLSEHGKDITVAILDNYHVRTDHVPNPLYKSLQNKLIPAVAAQQYSAMAAEAADKDVLPGYRYAVPDHGIFVAGIIHSIAPQATIRMLPVLDEWGTGDSFMLQTVLNSLADAIETNEIQGHVIINMSLVFSRFTDFYYIEGVDLDTIFEYVMENLFRLPFEALDKLNKPGRSVYIITSVGNTKDVPTGAKNPDTVKESDEYNIGSWLDLLKLILKILQIFFGGSSGKEEIVVTFGQGVTSTDSSAAPENDVANTPLVPEYPARYATKNIIGVSAARFGEKPLQALEAQWLDTFDILAPQHTTVFSSPPDTLPIEGFITYGGEVEPSKLDMPRLTSPKGIIGIYLSDYPDPAWLSTQSSTLQYTPNTSGWARWAGTSFSAPIVTGVLARALSSGKGVDSLRLSNLNKQLLPTWQSERLSL